MDTQLSLQARVQAATSAGQPLKIVGGGSKAFLCDWSDPDVEVLSTAEHSGVIQYQPEELTLQVRSGTRLQDVNKLLAEHGQMLPFEPPEYNANTTIGGTIAAGLAGPRRPFTGSVRDFVLGITLLLADGQVLVFGGQVMKNVAGYDVSRLQVGAMGTLGVILDISLKVLPLPGSEVTLGFAGKRQILFAKMLELARTSLPLSGLAIIDDCLNVRLSGSELGVSSAVQQLGGDLPDALPWVGLRDQSLEILQGDNLWRVSVQPDLPLLLDEAVVIDWAGGIRWLLCGEDPVSGRNAGSGHRTLFRSRSDSVPEQNRFSELDPVTRIISEKIKHAFDPGELLNPGRMTGGL